MDNRQIARAYGREAAIAHCSRISNQGRDIVYYIVRNQFWDWIECMNLGFNDMVREFDEAYWKWIDNYGKGE